MAYLLSHVTGFPHGFPSYTFNKYHLHPFSAHLKSLGHIKKYLTKNDLFNMTNITSSNSAPKLLKTKRHGTNFAIFKHNIFVQNFQKQRFGKLFHFARPF